MTERPAHIEDGRYWAKRRAVDAMTAYRSPEERAADEPTVIDLEPTVIDLRDPVPVRRKWSRRSART